MDASDCKKGSFIQPSNATSNAEELQMKLNRAKQLSEFYESKLSEAQADLEHSKG